VYQTFGEVWRGDEGPGQNVGTPLQGLHVRICDESDQVTLSDLEDMKVNETCSSVGEVVLFGMQIDKYSAYLNMEHQRPFARAQRRRTVHGTIFPFLQDW
jgi:hypothetical protein